MDNPMAWLNPLPGLRYRQGAYQLAGQEEPLTTFEAVVNAQAPRGRRIPRRVNEIRRALVHTLRYAHHPDLRDQGPWVPDDPVYRIYRSSLAPLLNHQVWSAVNVMAAPYLLHLPARPIAGAVDVVYQLQDGTVAIGVVHCDRPESPSLEAMLAELGGFIAAICDHRLFWPSHAVLIYAAPDRTHFEYHHPDVCLGRWVDAIDRTATLRRLQLAAA